MLPFKRESSKRCEQSSKPMEGSNSKLGHGENEAKTNPRD